MPSVVDQRESIADSLGLFERKLLPEAARQLFQTLGYQSDRRLPISTAKQFRDQLDPQGKLTDAEIETIGQLQSLHLLFQLTDAELESQHRLFESASEVQDTKIESYLFFAGDLPPGQYSRTELSKLVRAINKPLPMPAIVLLKYGERLSLGIIHRRLHKRDQARDVLDKVTLVKDIDVGEPIRAHLEILNDFALANLDAEFGVSNFVSLHEAWRKRLDTYELSKGFYREIADWYFWAHHQIDDGRVRLPQHCDTEQEQSLFLIRLLTRVIFCWFLVEKHLIPSDLFRERRLKTLLKDFQPSPDPKRPDIAPAYYRAILQNLFFGTLNMPQEQRGFRKKAKPGQRYDQNYGVTNLWRYEAYFRNAAEWEAYSNRIPFLNGGLFDCLDDKSGKKKDNFILDGFSDREDFGCNLPNDLFFGPERTVDLSRDYGEEDKRTARSKKARVRGLIGILSRYKFTIEENTPLEEEIALDPELLGKVFENLLASYNEDTRTTARKALGAFYTPREIVSYMVDEALKSYLGAQVPGCKGALEDLFSIKATLKDIKPETKDKLIAAIGRVKILDPACGSGAFPMGALHRLVDLLQKLDPNNESWKRDRLADARRERERLVAAKATKDQLAEVDARIDDIEKSFSSRLHALDFVRKLYLIESCIYGVDIQPIATQIAKLRFFISLIVDQRVDQKGANLGVRALPNLETRLVAADTLTPIEKSEGDLFLADLNRLRAELAEIRHEHFNARTPATKRKWRERDQLKRQEIAQRLETDGALDHKSAKTLAAWDPYDQNISAPFFDADWMFGRSDAGAALSPGTSKDDGGFDIVIGNPPYVRMEQIKHLKPLFSHIYQCFSGRADLYVYFYEKGVMLLRAGGVLSFISSDTFFNREFGEKLRGFLTKKTALDVVIDFGETGVFTAFTEPCIVLVRRGGESHHKVRVLKWDESESVQNVRAKIESKLFTLPQAHFGTGPWRIEPPKVNHIVKLLESSGRTVGTSTNHRILYGVKTGLNDAFVINDDTRKALLKEDKNSKELIKPFLRGRDIGRWVIQPTSAWLIYIPKGTDMSRFKAIEQHLRPFKKALEGRATKQEWYELQQAQFAYYDAFCGPKIVFQDIARSYGMAWDDAGHFLANTCYFIPGDFKWLLGILMSAPMRFYVHKVLGADEGGFIRLFSGQVDKFPIPESADVQNATLELLTDYLLWLNRHFAAHPATQTTRDPLMLAYWEQVLNGLVYELYFQEELRAADLHVFDLVDSAALPSLTKLPENERLSILRAKFEELYDTVHPIRIAIDNMHTLDSIRIIEVGA